MANRIPQEIIEEVLQQSNNVDVVGEYVALRKRGRNYFGLCPFHNEDTPSFSVNEDKQIYKCFGCGGWLQAREIKFSQGYTRPGPRDYVGRAPLDQRESRALAGYTEYIDPALVLAYHSQGMEIYWQFDDIQVPGAEELGQRLAAVSGYTLTRPEENSSYAGYKDWFIKTFRRPGYTVEVGSGVNPLPLEQFDEIYRDNLGILVTAALG